MSDFDQFFPPNTLYSQFLALYLASHFYCSKEMKITANYSKAVVINANESVKTSNESSSGPFENDSGQQSESDEIIDLEVPPGMKKKRIDFFFEQI